MRQGKEDVSVTGPLPVEGFEIPGCLLHAIPSQLQDRQIVKCVGRIGLQFQDRFITPDGFTFRAELRIGVGEQ
jgi:hypothetical protein